MVYKGYGVVFVLMQPYGDVSFLFWCLGMTTQDDTVVYGDDLFIAYLTRSVTMVLI